MLQDNDSPFITIYLTDVKPFLPDREAKRIMLRYLHDHGIEGELNHDEQGEFIRYYKPESFDEFSMDFYMFITKGGK